MTDDLILTDRQIDRLLDAIAAGQEQATAEQVRGFMVYAELRMREAALINGALNGHFAVRFGDDGWEFLPREGTSAA